MYNNKEAIVYFIFYFILSCRHSITIW